MLFERCHTKARMRSIKRHIKYFNFRSKVQLNHPYIVDAYWVIENKLLVCLDMLTPCRGGQCFHNRSGPHAHGQHLGSWGWLFDDEIDDALSFELSVCDKDSKEYSVAHPIVRHIVLYFPS